MQKLNCSFAGFRYALADKSFALECAVGVFFAPILLFYPNIGTIQKAIIFGTYGLLLAFELMNTAIEKLCDRISRQYDEDIKVIKDISSSAVFLIVLILICEIILIYLHF